MEDKDLIEIGRDLYGSLTFPEEGRRVSIPDDDPPKEILELGLFEDPNDTMRSLQLESISTID